MGLDLKQMGLNLESSFLLLLFLKLSTTSFLLQMLRREGTMVIQVFCYLTVANVDFNEIFEDNN